MEYGVGFMGAFGNGKCIWERKGAQKHQTQNWRASCDVFRVKNRVGGSVCEALLEPTPVAPPHAAPLGF